MSAAPFRDRAEAGRLLGARLAESPPREPVVLALPRGGVPIAVEVAAALGAPLDLLVARKITAPGEPELGIGAVAEEGVRLLSGDAVDTLGLTPQALAAASADAEAELERRVARYRGPRPVHPLAGRTALIVDDGLATGVTAAAAVHAARRRGAARVVVGAPVCPPSTRDHLETLADEVVCLRTPATFRAVGEHYLDFGQLSDEEVGRLLAAHG